VDENTYLASKKNFHLCLIFGPPNMEHIGRDGMGLVLAGPVHQFGKSGKIGIKFFLPARSFPVFLATVITTTFTRQH
jgi:hypothetical protein